MSNYEYNKTKPIKIPSRVNSIKTNNNNYGYYDHRFRLKSESFQQDSSFSIIFPSHFQTNGSVFQIIFLFPFFFYLYYLYFLIF
jgi:hypothetical protein